jgi:glutamate-1-semialdehyde 2,1-aminomutase
MVDGQQSNSSWHKRASSLTPAGVHSNARLVGADVVFTHGLGPWLFDVEGHRHIDYMLGRGPAFLGHTPSAVNDAVHHAASNGLTLGSGTTLEVAAATAALSVIEWADQIRFVSSGTEAVQSAFRLARAATGKSLIVQFDGIYHGWIDNVSLVPGQEAWSAVAATAGQAPASGAHSLLLPWNDVDAVERAFAVHGSDIAAVITEPVNIFGGILAAPGYLEALREITLRHGAALIFDEVVSGFRLRPGTAVPMFGVTPDLATYAKAMGSGWPVAAVAGTTAMFDGVASDRVRLSGTYNGNAAAMAAITATVSAMENGEVHAAASRIGNRLQSALVEVAASRGVQVSVEGFPTAFWLVFDMLERSASDRVAEAFGVLLRRYNVIQYHHTWLVSAAHDDEAIAFTMSRVAEALGELIESNPAIAG